MSVPRRAGGVSVLGWDAEITTAEQQPRRTGKGKPCPVSRGCCQKQNADSHLLTQTTNCPFEELNEQIKSNWITRYRMKLVVGFGLMLRSATSSSVPLESLSTHLSIFLPFWMFLLFLLSLLQHPLQWVELRWLSREFPRTLCRGDCSRAGRSDYITHVPQKFKEKPGSSGWDSQNPRTSRRIHWKVIQAFEVANCAVRKDVKIIWDTGLPLLAFIFTFSVTLNSNSVLISSIFFFY